MFCFFLLFFLHHLKMLAFFCHPLINGKQQRKLDGVMQVNLSLCSFVFRECAHICQIHLLPFFLRAFGVIIKHFNNILFSKLWFVLR